MTYSGLQKEILSLYRRALRLPAKKPPAARSNFRLFIRYTFRTTASTVDSKDIPTIEYFVRQERRRLEMLESPNVLDISVSDKMRQWERAN